MPEPREVGFREYREVILRPYRIVYRIRDARVEIAAVFDGRRDLEELLIDRALES